LKANKTEELVAVVALTPNQQQKNLLEGKVRDLSAGTYRIELDIAELRDPPSLDPAEAKSGTQDPRAAFTGLSRTNDELLDLSTDWELLGGLAEESQGRLFTPETVEQVLDLLARKVAPRELRQDSKPWQDEPLVWWSLGVLVGLLTLEWLWRK